MWVITFSFDAAAGEIAGLPLQLPLTVERDVEIVFSNDFLGRGGSVDDFRTQQLMISAAFGDRWIATIDHSILTISDPPSPARIDQLSGSVGYRLRDDAGSRLTVGVGFRSAGDFAGERMQNGSHRLVGSEVERFPYADISGTDATLWVDVQRNAVWTKEPVRQWHLGYWLRGSSLLTSDGQWDSTAGAFVVASRGSIDAWLGLRRDWRSGYQQPVLRETADEEDDLGVSLGLRWGSLVLETVQQFDNDASFGQLRFMASSETQPSGTGRSTRFGVDATALIPDVHVKLAGRYRLPAAADELTEWRRSIVVSATFGEPQVDNEPFLFARSTQFAAGFELERPLAGTQGWASLFGSLGAGWRRERLVTDDDFPEERSTSVDSAVVLASLGLRLHAGTQSDSSRYRLQLGLEAWIPTSDAELRIRDATFDAQQPSLAIALGFSMEL